MIGHICMLALSSVSDLVWKSHARVDISSLNSSLSVMSYMFRFL